MCPHSGHVREVLRGSTASIGHSADWVASTLVQWLEARGLHGLLTEAEQESPDPHAVLRAVDRRHPGSDLVAELEEHVTQEELKAVSSAHPTPFADPLIHTWRAKGARPAIAGDNSRQAVRAYLESRHLTSSFAPYIYGRTLDLHLLKPDPHVLNRALTGMGADPRHALMIGDAPADYEAALQAGVPFLGYARNERQRKLLMNAGAQLIVESLDQVLGIVRSPA
ncbi:HAD family hydrolase [Streptomyces sp. NPDC008343]|uniref:HAD family hydrolase n=1 Tax=Streptomyces sp. NPDC008343 TaxID=3364828 RepID=UPI0036E93E56